MDLSISPRNKAYTASTIASIGTKIASKVLKDGMQVEVDATKGVVRIIK